MIDPGLLLLLFLAAAIYTAVGHGGASGYLASMSFYAIAPETMRPAALVLNIVAAAPTTWRFVSAGHFDSRLFLPLAVGSVPFAVWGSQFTLPDRVFRVLIAVALFAAAVRLAWPTRTDGTPQRRMPAVLGVLIGAAIGFLAGLTGIGGGVYLSPIILLAGWAGPKSSAGVSAAFILVNSIAGLSGRLAVVPELPREVWLWAGIVLCGGLLGSTLGSRYFSSRVIRQLLAIVLAVAAVKMMLPKPPALPRNDDERSHSMRSLRLPTSASDNRSTRVPTSVPQSGSTTT